MNSLCPNRVDTGTKFRILGPRSSDNGSRDSERTRRDEPQNPGSWPYRPEFVPAVSDVGHLERDGSGNGARSLCLCSARLFSDFGSRIVKPMTDSADGNGS